jgi:endothelin-converting enzyme/putative endopeptidase
MRSPFLLLVLAFMALANAFGQNADSTPRSQSGIDLTAIDKSADPCADFYQYACGNWLKNNPIPKEESRWGRFSELHERNQKILRQIAEDSAVHTDRSPLDQKVGDFYGACMAESEIEKLGTKPLQDELERIKAIQSSKDLVDEVSRLHARQVGVFFSFGASPDPDDAKMEMANFDQGGLGLPEKDYYFRTDPTSIELRKKYVDHIAKMLELIGVAPADAQKKADTVMKIETELAKGSLDVIQRRDPKNLVHKFKTDQLAGLSPQFNMREYFTDLGAPSFGIINVAAPDFIKTVSQVIQTYKMDGVKDYLTWTYVSSSARALPKAFVDENFEFYGKILTGAQELRPRWKRCVQMTDGELGEAIGKKYVEMTFGKEGKARTLEMVNEIEHEMALDIQSLTWMSAETKTEALKKLKGVTNKIGYPDKWRDYSKLDIVKGDYLGNMYRANQFDTKRDRSKIGKPVDRTEWEMTPPTVNAYYDPTQNNINFPAGILQPPFYSNKADDAVNYGGIGAVVGHELTHGFDDEGRQFDANGNLRDWWQKKDEEAFNKLAECIEEEYSSFQPIPGVHIRGKLTLGENTADNGGLRLAYMALMDSLAKHTGEVNRQKDGYSTQQRFFIGWGQIWCENERPESARLLVQTNPHSPGKYRVNGVVKNMETFTQAWGCKPDQSMFAAPGKSCRVW